MAGRSGRRRPPGCAGQWPLTDDDWTLVERSSGLAADLLASGARLSDQRLSLVVSKNQADTSSLEFPPHQRTSNVQDFWQTSNQLSAGVTKCDGRASGPARSLCAFPLKRKIRVRVKNHRCEQRPFPSHAGTTRTSYKFANLRKSNGREGTEKRPNLASACLAQQN